MYKQIFYAYVPYRLPGDPTLIEQYGPTPDISSNYLTTPPRMYAEEFDHVNAMLVKKEATATSPMTITLNVASRNIYTPFGAQSIKFDGTTGALIGYGKPIGDSLYKEVVQSQDGSLWSTMNVWPNRTELYELDPVSYTPINTIRDDFFELPADLQFHGISHPMVDRPRNIIVMAGYPADAGNSFILVNNFATGALIRRIWVSGPVVQIMQEDDRRCFVVCTNGIINLVDYTTGKIISTTRTPVSGPVSEYKIIYAWDFVLRRLLAFNFVDGSFFSPPINPDGSSSNSITGYYPVPLATNVTKPIPLKPPRKGQTVPMLVRAVGDAGEPIPSLPITVIATTSGTIGSGPTITNSFGYATINLVGIKAGSSELTVAAHVDDGPIGTVSGNTGGSGGGTGSAGPGGGTSGGIIDPSQLPQEGLPNSSGKGLVNSIAAAQIVWGDVWYRTPSGAYTRDSAQGTVSHITERRIFSLNLAQGSAMPYSVGDYILIRDLPNPNMQSAAASKTWTVGGISTTVELKDLSWEFIPDLNVSSYVYFHRVARVTATSFELWAIRSVASQDELTRLLAMPSDWTVPYTANTGTAQRDTYGNYTSHADPRPRSFNGIMAPVKASPWPGSPVIYGISPDKINPSSWTVRGYDVLLGDAWYRTPAGEWTTDSSLGVVSHITLRKRLKTFGSLFRVGDVASTDWIPYSQVDSDAAYKQWTALDGTVMRYAYVDRNEWGYGTPAYSQKYFEHVIRVVEDDEYEIWSALPLSSEAELQRWLSMPTGWTGNYVNMTAAASTFGLNPDVITYDNPYPLSYNGVLVNSGTQTMTGSGLGTDSGGGGSTGGGSSTGGGTSSAPSGQPIPVGSQIAPLSVENTSTGVATNQPFTIGHAFAPGHLPGSGAAITLNLPDGTAIASQLNVKATHADGSVRHAMVSGVIPSIAAGANLVLSMKRATASASAAPVGLPASLPSAKLVINGVTWTATPTSSTQYITWFAGPVASDFVFNVPFVDGGGNAHPTLIAQFSVRAFSTGHVRIDYVIEHCKAYTSTADITYNATLYAAGQPVYTRTGLVHTPAARWKRTFWQGMASTLHVKHDIPYLLDSRQVPNYDRSITIAESYLAGLATDLASGKFDPMQFGRFQPYMPNTGGRPDIGLMPDSHAALLLSMDKRAWDVVMAAGDIGGSWPMCRRDDSTGPGAGYPLSVVNFPYASLLGTMGDTVNPATGKAEHLPVLTSATTGVPDSSHQPAIYYLPYLLTGDYFYLEGLHFACTFNHYQDNPYYRLFADAIVKSDQVRGQSWSLRTMAEAAAITPDDHYLKSHFSTWYDKNMAWFLNAYLDAINPDYTNPLGIITNGYSVVYEINNMANTGMAPWQDDFFTQALGHGYELLGLDTTKRLLMWKAKFQIGRMNDPAVCVQNACIYALGVRSTASSPFFSTLAECFNSSVPAEQEQYACGSAPRLALANSPCLAGDIDGYPASESGYPANYQPALAAAVDIGYTGGAQAWTKFMARPTKPDYGRYGAQWAVVPRTV